MSIWDELRAHRAATEGVTLTERLSDPARFGNFSIRLGDMVLDYSKTSINAHSRDLLVRLAETSGLAAKRAAMFAGEKINVTEDRAVLHTALRGQPDQPVFVDGVDVMPGVAATLSRMRAFSDGVRDGSIAAADGGRFSDVVNIGIGGSDLGPAMATTALAPYHDGPRTHFVSNIDAAHITDTMKRLDPKRTLVIVASKTFTTIETMTNAAAARNWLAQAVGEDIGRHLVALSSAQGKTAEFGIDPARVFGFEDWVGGRYSLWGPIGLSLMLAIGADRFRAFLGGAYEMDQHFCNAAKAENMPVMLGLMGIWHNNFCGYPTRAVLPYDQRLARLPAYLQQLDMESNGKRVRLDGSALSHATGPVVWGEPGTNGQHAFYQLVHQGTATIPCEFLVAAEGHEPELKHQHDLLLANCLAQSEALARGRSLAEATDAYGPELAPHRAFPGNRPSLTLIYRKLDPATLGRIIALYEHRVFVEGCIWGINSFDQWGVELGKELATAILPMVEGAAPRGKDASTAGLLAALRGLRG